MFIVVPVEILASIETPGRYPERHVPGFTKKRVRVVKNSSIFTEIFFVFFWGVDV